MRVLGVVVMVMVIGGARAARWAAMTAAAKWGKKVSADSDGKKARASAGVAVWPRRLGKVGGRSMVWAEPSLKTSWRAGSARSGASLLAISREMKPALG